MRRVLSFGDYTFPDTIPARGEILRTNFANGVTRTVRLPGMDGGYDEYGSDRLASEIGNVRYRFMLVAETPSEMADLRDEVMALADLGITELTIETPAGDERWTWAKVNNISMPTQPDVYSDKMVEVTIDWQVTLPRWFSDSEDSPQVEACSGTDTTFMVANGGNAAAVPIFTIDPSTDLTSGITIQRLVSAVVVDEIDFDAALLASDVLVIDCKALAVKKNGSDAYGTAFSADHPAWLRLLPGDNTIKVILGGGESASVTVEWNDTWR